MKYRCLAKTHQFKQCQRNGINGLCRQHNLIYQKYKLIEQQGGFPLLPSCLDVIRCDWVTNLSYAVPGLNFISNLLSY